MKSVVDSTVMSSVVLLSLTSNDAVVREWCCSSIIMSNLNVLLPMAITKLVILICYGMYFTVYGDYI